MAPTPYTLDRVKYRDTIATVLDIPGLMEGDTVVTKGYTTVGDGGGNEYIFRAGTLVPIPNPTDGGFSIDLDGTAWLEAVDQSIVEMHKFGVFAGASDQSVQMQAAFDTAASNQLDVRLWTGTAYGSVHVICESFQMPSVYGISRSVWSAFENNKFALTMEELNSGGGEPYYFRNTVVSNVKFYSPAQSLRHGIQISVVAGPYLANCEFYQCGCGILNNASYGLRLNQCHFQNSSVALINTSRVKDDSIPYGGATINQSIPITTDPKLQKNPNTFTADQCEWSNNSLAIMFESPNTIYGVAFTSLFDSCIIQGGSGNGCWFRGDTNTNTPYSRVAAPPIKFVNTHWELFSAPYEIDGETIEGDITTSGIHLDLGNAVNIKKITATNYTQIKCDKLTIPLDADGLDDVEEGSTVFAKTVYGGRRAIRGDANISFDIMLPEDIRPTAGAGYGIGPIAPLEPVSQTEATGLFTRAGGADCTNQSSLTQTGNPTVDVVLDSSSTYGYVQQFKTTGPDQGGTVACDLSDDTLFIVTFRARVTASSAGGTPAMALWLYDGTSKPVYLTDKWQTYIYTEVAQSARTSIWFRTAADEANALTWEMSEVQVIAFDNTRDCVNFQKSKQYVGANPPPVSESTNNYGLNDSSLELMMDGDSDRDGVADPGDYSFKSHIAAWSGTPTYADGPPGFNTKAFQFGGPGTTPYVDLQEFYTPVDNFTAALWLNTNDTTANGTAVMNIADATGWAISTVGGSVLFYDSAFTSKLIAGISNDTWIHVAVVVDSGTAQGYLNGVAFGAPFTPTLVENTEPNWWIGRWKNIGSQVWDGEIFDFRVYNRPLSTDDLAQIILPPPEDAALFGQAVVDEVKQNEAHRDYQQTNQGVTENFDFSTGPRNQLIGLSSSVTATLTAIEPGEYNIIVVQDATGGWNITWPAGIVGDAPAIDLVPNARTLCTLYYDGSVWFWSTGTPLDYQQALAPDESIDFSIGPRNQRLDLTADVTISLVRPSASGHYSILFVQDATGGHVVTWPGIRGTERRVSTAANSSTLISLYYDASQDFWHWPGSGNLYEFDKRTGLSNLSDTFTEIGNLSVDYIPDGVYEFKFSLTYNYDQTDQSVYFRFRVDGGTWNELSHEPKDVTDNEPWTYFYPSSETAGPKQLELQIRKESAVGVLNVLFVDTIIQRVG